MDEQYERKSDTQWEWTRGTRHCGVRLFPVTRSIIWSSWVATANGPVFDEGVSQTFDDFLAAAPAYYDPPTAMIDEMRQVVAKRNAHRGRGLRWWPFGSRR